MGVKMEGDPMAVRYTEEEKIRGLRLGNYLIGRKFSDKFNGLFFFHSRNYCRPALRRTFVLAN
jgi:hypothetical protein